MKPGDLDAVFSSPPYADAINTRAHGIKDERRNKDNDDIQPAIYGSTAGQLGSMPSGDLAAAISSPPYADTIENGDGPGARWDAEGHPGNPDKVSSDASYGRSPGQVGRLDGVISSSPFEAGIPQQDKNFLLLLVIIVL